MSRFPRTIDPERTAPVLYVHPRSQMYLEEIVPISIPAIVNRIDSEVVGRFERELTDRHIRAARVVLMDIHWYLTLPAAMRLAERIRRVNPAALIVAGGLTASNYARLLVEQSSIDVVIRGDGEGPTPALVAAALAGRGFEDVPNLVHKNYETPLSYVLNLEEMEKSRYNDLDFFPTLVKRLEILHRRVADRPLATHPFLLAFRGCVFDCDHCYGAKSRQKPVFGRSSIFRTPENLAAELTGLSDDPRWRFVNLYHDFVSTLPLDYSQRVFSRPYDLYTLFEFFSMPSREGLSLLLNAFRGGVIGFSADLRHGTTDAPAPAEELIDRIRMTQQTGRYRIRLAYSRHFMREGSSYRDVVTRVAAKTRVLLYDTSYWWNEVPEPTQDAQATEAGFRHFSRNRGKRYHFINALFRAALFFQRWFPDTVNDIAEMVLCNAMLFGRIRKNKVATETPGR